MKGMQRQDGKEFQAQRGPGGCGVLVGSESNK